MSRITRVLGPFGASIRFTVLAISGLALAGCVARVRVAAPPPVVVEPAVVDVQVREAPPPLPDYEQPPCPVDGYLWTPGYWAWAAGGYYWVPGTWVAPPHVGFLWTPGYWGFVGGVYTFHAGYWGPHVGFYGGVNYGFGYVGTGFAGGAWVGGAFSYNRAVTNVNVTVVHNTYNTTVVNNVTVNRVSYNGGAGGTVATPSRQERQFAQEAHEAPTPMQRQHVQQAQQNPALFAHANGGHPTIAATARPAAFTGPGVIRAHGAGAPPAGRPASQGFQPQQNANQAQLNRPAANPQAAPKQKQQKPRQKQKPHASKEEKRGEAKRENQQ